MEEIKVKKKKPLFSRFEWFCIIIFAVFGIIGIILHFLGYDDIKGNAAEVQTLASQTDYLLVSKNDPYIMIGTPDPDGELETTVLKVDSFGFYNYFKAPADLIIDPFHSAFVGWNTLYNAIMGVSNTTINDGSSLLRYRMSAGNLNEFTGYMPVTTISHQDYNIVKGCIYAEGGGYAWLSTSNFVKPAPVPRISGDLINAYYFYVWEDNTSHYYAVTTTGALHLHRASFSDAASRIVYRDGMMLYSYESGAWQGPIGASQSMLDDLGLPYIMNFENAAGMVMYDDACMAAVWMQSFEDQQATPTPTLTPAPSSSSELEYWFKTADGEYYFVNIAYNESYGYDLLNDYPPFVYVRNQYSNYNELPLIRPAIVETKQSISTINSYFAGTSVSYVHIYDIGITYITDSNYIKSTFDYVDVTDATKYNNGYYDIECRLESSTQGSFNLYSFYLRKSNWGQNVVYVGSNIASYSFNSSYNSLTGLNFSSGYESSCPVVYGIELMTDVRSDPNLPTPTATPTPSPTPTQPPYIVIVTPVPEATPTPVVKLDPIFPSSMPPLNSGTVSSVLETGNTYLDNNNAITVLSRALAFVPNTVLSLWWFWLFVLVILAGIRVFIHFF